ncbi:hypothetical protein P353_08320 [Comamonas testosteroni]|uniref:Uncharacterized protein n=1 Tax=Comamonas testosteroni TaxID=285 RepID=A0A096FKG4_COMTE|nr:hypothetical protein P353_08320 [Comamonas testosteroni]
MKLPELNAFPRRKAFAIDAMAVLGKKLWQKSGLKERVPMRRKRSEILKPQNVGNSSKSQKMASLVKLNQALLFD